MDAAKSAKIIRQELKKEFPSTKFSVRISRYSGGSSIKIKWTDEASFDKVKSMLSVFKGISFDGMTDSTNYQKTFWEEKKYVLVLIYSILDIPVKNSLTRFRNIAAIASRI